MDANVVCGVWCAVCADWGGGWSIGVRERWIGGGEGKRGREKEWESAGVNKQQQQQQHDESRLRRRYGRAKRDTSRHQCRDK